MMTEPLTANPSPRPLNFPPLWDELLQMAQNWDGSPLYLVGGAVRDAYLKRPIHDLDLATADDGRKFAKAIANKFKGAFYALDEERGVGRAIIKYGADKYVIDVARFRGETLEDDLNGRDFAINALAVPLIMPTDGENHSKNYAIIDIVGGIPDLDKKLIRRCSETSLMDDPIRVLRAIRQSVALGFMIEPQTRADLRHYGERIFDTSIERVRDEFMTILGGARPHVALRTLETLGLLKLIIPETVAMRGVTQSLPHIYDVWEHTLSVVERMYGILVTISPARTDDSAADAAYGMVVYLLDRFRRTLQTHLTKPLPNDRSVQSLLILAALFHDVGKPHTRTVDDNGRIHFYRHEMVGADMVIERANALRLSNEETERLTAIVQHHMRPMTLHQGIKLDADGEINLSRRVIYRYWKGTGETVGVDVGLLTLADHLGMVGTNFVLQDWLQHLQIVGRLLEGLYHERESLVAPPPLLNGGDLIKQFDLKPSPLIGEILAALIEAQATKEVTTIEQALELARHIVETSNRREG